MRISVGGQHFEDTVVNGQKSDIESTTTQIEDKNVGFSSSLVHTVSNGSSSRLVNNTFDLQTSNGSGILCGLTLGIVEVGRDGDDGVVNFFSQKCLGSELHFLQDHGRHFFWCVGGRAASLCDLNHGLVLVGDNFIRHQLLIRLD
mmetsp:Transcript_25691/g.53514  ORF Transcript_25691/g.53514 Transcript_25691/m.53514 type:complete len:145 (-) Transcript_25691:437-871(-)